MSVITGSEGRLTPEQVRSTSFSPARFGRRGLDEDQVKAFCGKVEDEIVFLLNERTSLFQQVEQLRARFRDTGDAEPEYVSGVAHMQAVRILASAQKTAERFVGDAQDYCRDLADNARLQRDQLIFEARANAARMLEEADTEARAAAMEVARQSTAVPVGEQATLHDEIAYLRMFSEVYRTHLKTYLEALLRNVDEWGRTERSPDGHIG